MKEVKNQQNPWAKAGIKLSQFETKLKTSYGVIPEHMLESLNNYVLHGVPTGDFLYAVLSNDLFEAFGRADSGNQAAMKDYVMYIYNFLPTACWGSSEAVDGWLARKKTERSAPTSPS